MAAALEDRFSSSVDRSPNAIRGACPPCSIGSIPRNHLICGPQLVYCFGSVDAVQVL